jgi:hypothetical protein
VYSKGHRLLQNKVYKSYRFQQVVEKEYPYHYISHTLRDIYFHNNNNNNMKQNPSINIFQDVVDTLY